MGIPGLWDVLGEGEVRHIADYASDHFKQHGRPLRIAVDEATWRFTNLTDEQVTLIRDGKPAANPIENTILWRILRLWRLNIQLLFVWDGLRKPGKTRRAGRGGGKVDPAIVKMLHRMLEMLRVPYHKAPGEAEAECARLQQLGIVDAVWSDDGDSLMFGCTTLIKQHKVAQKAVKDHIRIYRASVDLERHDLDARSLVVFALVSGGDYDTTGIKGCGASAAKAVSKRKHGLGRGLNNVMDERDLKAWKDSLVSTLRQCRKDAVVPEKFPEWKVFKGYRDPAISTDERLRNLRLFRGGWAQPMNEPKLRDELRAHYNFTTREYLKHIAPLFLVRKLVNASTPQKKEENLTYEVQMKRTQKKKPVDGEEPPAKSEAKILYSAHLLVGIDLTSRPDEEDWTKFTKNGVPYDPLERVDCEIPACFLSHGLPEGSYETPPAVKRRKKKADISTQDDAEPAEAGDTPASRASRALEPSASAGTTSSAPPQGSKKRKSDTPKDKEPKKRRKPSKEASANTESGKKRKRKGKEPVEEPASPPPAQFKRIDISDIIPSASSATRRTPVKPAKVIDLCDDESEEEDVSTLFVSPMTNAAPIERVTSKPERPRPSLGRAFSPTPQRGRPAVPDLSSILPVHKDLQQPRTPDKVPSSGSAVSKTRDVSSQQMPMATPMTWPPAPPGSQNLIPGEAINAATLRELRMAALLRAPADNRKPETVEPVARTPTINRIPEIIDLT